jgi:non-specific serine/threonine protein kinase/serine/threonine-protein kinase
MNDDRLPPEDESAEMTRLPEPEESAPSQVGNYRILQKVGEGGMGEVYEAEQLQPVRRRVALKLIKRGMDSKAVVARFESERQALALMNHATIARVFDAGVTVDGRPFFAMEYVKGIPITDYCDRNRLPVRDRLELFMKVCEGIQHAHQKGIIHRDIKPSNILVTVQDSEPAPKIIDFGVAKATDLRLTDRTVYTEMGQLIGTPEYMSPEQTDLTGLDIDTRTDVYSLGVLLYELLVGAQPFAASDLRSAGFDEFRRMIREEQPPRPSTQVQGLGEAVTMTAKKRTTNPPALTKQLRGDLDWIVLKALEKDRTRRYDSASELAADIRRHLNQEPVLACPPSMLYRFGKFVRRHKAGASAALFIAIALVVGITGTTIGMIRATRAEKEASTVSEFLVGLFKVSDPSETRGKTITAKEILDRGAQRIREDLADQPQIQARLMGTMGDVYLNLGLYDQSGPLLEQALEKRAELFGDEHPVTLSSQQSLATLYLQEGRYDEAEPLCLRTLEARKEVLGEEHEETLASMTWLANLYRHQGRYDEAEALYVRALDGRRRVLGEDHPDTLNVMMDLGSLHLRRGRYAEAEKLYTKVLETKKIVLGADHPDTLKSMNNLASLFYMQGRYKKAEQLYLETIEARNRVLGEDHPATLGTAANLASLYQDQKRYDEALPICRRVLETETRILGEDHRNTLLSMVDLAYLLQADERFDEAEPLYLRALEIQRRKLGEDHPDSLTTMSDLAFLYLRMGRYSKSGRLYREALEKQRRILGAGHPSTLGTLYGLISLEALQGRRSEALDLLRQAVDDGWDEADWAREDPDLASLQGDPEFEAILAEID